jgi:peptidoglycan/xylan/chitin deacetylase (PgdA/CDA1 family)
VHAGAKALAEQLLCASGAPRVARLRHAGGALVLAYHDIVPDEVGDAVRADAAGDASLHLPQRAFARQLDLLRKRYEIVPLPRVLDTPGPGGRPRVAITFDDAYEGALTAGVAELERRGLPATVFVAPAFVGGGDFWWDALAGPEGLPERVRAHALLAFGGRDAGVRAWAAAAGVRERPLPAFMKMASEARLSDAIARGITLASHTWSHPALPALSADELAHELARPLAWLRERFPGILDWIAYPYGATSAAVEQAARVAGYAAALRVDGGWITRPGGADRFSLPRLNVPAAVSLKGFELRAAGIVS